MSLRVAHVVDSISPGNGGPPDAVLHLAAAQSALGAEIRLVTYAHPNNQIWWTQWREQIPGLTRIEFIELRHGLLSRRREVTALRSLRTRADIMHVHGIWRSLTWNALSARLRGGAATLLALHGTLSRWSLAQHRLRKKLALDAGWRRVISSADMLHAVSVGEEDDIKALFKKSRVALIPNGVPASTTAPPAVGQAKRPGAGYVLFLARLHEVKGPDLLLEAFAEIANTPANHKSDFKLIMAGPDYGMHAALEAQAKHLGIEHSVEFPGAIYGEPKRRLLAGALLVCQPSRYDAFSITLLESLAAGVPVVTTPEASFPELHDYGAGIVCGGNPRELARSMRLILEQPELRNQMGRRGRDLVHNNYTWERIAVRATKLYEGLIEGGCARESRNHPMENEV